MNFKKVFIFLLVVAVFSTISFVSVYAAPKNLALNAKVEASGYFADAEGDESPAMAVDGDIETKWCARPDELKEDADLGHWIIIDFGAAKSINKYVIQNASLCERDLGKMEFNLYDFVFEYSNDKTKWTSIDDVSANEEETYEKTFSPVSARYVRLSSLSPTSTGDMTVRLPEIEVYEADPNATVAPATVKPASTPTVAPTIAPTVKPTEKPAATQQVTVKPSDIPVDGKADNNSDVTLYIIIGAAVVLIGGGAAFLLIKKKKA
jgi:LPXTG-motif cell wall-anchored protein